MALFINEMGEFVDGFDPNPDERRKHAYQSLRKIDPALLRPSPQEIMEQQRKYSKKEGCKA